MPEYIRDTVGLARQTEELMLEHLRPGATSREVNDAGRGILEIPVLTQCGLRVRSDVPIVVQVGRLDTTQANLAYSVNIGYYEDASE